LDEFHDQLYGTKLKIETNTSLEVNYGSTLFYVLDANTIQLVPQIGVAGEVYASNKHSMANFKNTARMCF
jgi:hypothetical protein